MFLEEKFKVNWIEIELKEVEIVNKKGEFYS